MRRIPPPQGDREAPLQALIIDSWFDNYLGVVSLVRVKTVGCASATRSLPRPSARVTRSMRSVYLPQAARVRYAAGR